MRPVHAVHGNREVTFKGKRFPVLSGDRIEVGKTPPERARKPESQKESPAPVRRDSPGPGDWTDEQRAIIDAPVAARLIVEAAPGTGKTAVACARVAALLRNGVSSNSIWLVSFTRTAIHEIRNRIAELSTDIESAHGVRIATIDSHAWQLRQGFDGAKRDVFSTFEEGIDEAIALLDRADSDLVTELEAVDHLLIDEAQDVVGNRRELLSRIIRLMRRDSGVTVLCDPAQAIYGFTEDDAPVAGDEPLPNVLKADEESGFSVCELTDVKRTSSPGLRHIFVDTRRLVLHQKRNSMAKLLLDLREHSDGGVAMEIGTNDIAGREDVLVLYRKRSEVLTSGAYLANGGTAFRIRMSGYPTRIAPWLGAVFHASTTPVMTESEFLQRFAEVVPARWRSPEPATAWTALVRHAGRSQKSIDAKRLREVLSRSQPPLDFASPELGESGPILGTIHASKGREADEVHLMLADLEGTELIDPDEVRVVFVGATRARSVLKLGPSGGRYSSATRSGRCFHASRDGKRAQVEVGRVNDLDEASLVSRALFPEHTAALASQQLVNELGAEPVRVAMKRMNVGGDDWRWRLITESNGTVIGQLAEQLSNDFWEIVKAASSRRRGSKVRPPMAMRNIFLLGCRTIVRPHGDASLPQLHEPWASSGFWLAPVLFSYSMAYFNA